MPPPFSFDRCDRCGQPKDIREAIELEHCENCEVDIEQETGALRGFGDATVEVVVDIVTPLRKRTQHDGGVCARAPLAGQPSADGAVINAEVAGERRLPPLPVQQLPDRAQVGGCHLQRDLAELRGIKAGVNNVLLQAKKPNGRFVSIDLSISVPMPGDTVDVITVANVVSVFAFHLFLHRPNTLIIG